MTPCLVFNHHSLPFDASDAANQSVPDFLRICLKAKQMGFSMILVDESIDQKWFRLELAHNYFWQDWYGVNRNGENKDIIRAFLSIATRQPFFSEKDIDEGLELFDVRFNGKTSFLALRAAAWNEAPLTSFPTRDPWTTSPLRIEVDSLNASGEIETRSQDLLNFYSIPSFENEINQFQKRINSLITSGKALYDQRTELFPNLTFCGKAPQQLNSWSASHTILEQVKEALTHLNTFTKMWKNGVYQSYSADSLRDSGLNHRVSGESETVLNTPQLRRERTFWLPEGREAIFENHVKLAKGYRLHFFPDHDSRHLYVGYIGPHLKLS
ncbi:hypothetical protein WDW89_22485 [Deltaproteobacteria bacterium TL4]